jgi:hypothetical protein
MISLCVPRLELIVNYVGDSGGFRESRTIEVRQRPLKCVYFLFPFICLRLLISVWLISFSFAFAHAQNVTTTLNAIDASLQSAKSEMAFSAKFTLVSGWHKSLTTKVDDAFFQNQTDPDLEQAHGTLFVRGNSYKVEVIIDSPFHTSGGQSSFSSATIVSHNGVRLSYQPSAISVEGSRFSESLRADFASLAPSDYLNDSSISGAFFCPYVSAGFSAGAIFREKIRSGIFEFIESRESTGNQAPSLLRITASTSGPTPLSINWLFDDSGGRPTLLQRETETEKITYLDFVELKNGVRFPMQAIVARGTFVVGGKSLCEVKRWTFTDFRDESPTDAAFDLEITKDCSILGFEHQKGKTRVSIFDIDTTKIGRGAASVVLPPNQIENADEQFRQQAFRNGNASQAGRFVLVAIFAVLAVIAGIMFLRSFK